MDSETTDKEVMAMMSEVFGAAIRSYRESYGLTQGEVAARLGHNHAWLSRVEGGKRFIGPEEFRALINAVDDARVSRKRK